MESIVPNLLNTFVGWLLNTILPFNSKYRIQYDELRYKTAEALTMYANCLRNPINIDQYNLSDNHQAGSYEFRRLASGFDALSKVLPQKVKVLPIGKDQLKNVSQYLMGLSNSFSYSSSESYEYRKEIREWLKEVRTILDIRD